ncbi:fibronectin type III domain-containing protein, partial [Vallicoccus soli]|uniref:fibronectin type III domain-containing protein n=1 Tax=Vallicoccus soli TaxID=2339232 RepID=UPI001C4998B4
VAHYAVLRDGVEVAAVTGTSYEGTGLANDVEVHYAVVAVDGHGNRSPASDAVAATPTDLTPPDAPAPLVADRGDGSVRLSWTPSQAPDVAHYAVLRDGVEVATVGGTSYEDTGLANDVEVHYAVVAVDGHGNRSPASDAVAATPTDLTPPDAPSDLQAERDEALVRLAWTGSTSPDVVEHVVRRDGVDVAVVVGTEHVDAPGDGAEHLYEVVAVDGHGNRSAPVAFLLARLREEPTTTPDEGAGETGGLAASPDGRFVVVGTRARREASDLNTAYELHLLDRRTGAVRRIAPLPPSATGATDPVGAAAPSVSDDGRYVALATTRALVPQDTNGLLDAYRLDTATGTWALASVPPAGRVGTTAGTLLQAGASVHATSPTVLLSGDGDLVVFYSARADLVPGDTNGAVDVFAKRMSTGAVVRVSSTPTGASLPRAATGPALALTPDGSTVDFPATSSGGPTVLYRAVLGPSGVASVRVVSSVVVGGRATEYGVSRDAGDLAVSDDGRYVALVTPHKLGTPTPGAVWSTGLAHRLDTATGQHVALGTGQTSAWEHRVELDPTGRWAFFSTAAAGVPEDTDGRIDHYRRDLGGDVAGALVRVTVPAVAGAGPTGAVTPAEHGRLLAATGDRVLVLTSQPLLPGDANRRRDLYARDLAAERVTSPLG